MRNFFKKKLRKKYVRQTSQVTQRLLRDCMGSAVPVYTTSCDELEKK